MATEPANLKGYWKCDETSGTTLADSSGNSKNLTITGAINANYWLGETGEQGTCFRTDGVAGYASRNDAVIPSLDNTNFTLFALFKGGTDFGVPAALAISNSSTANDRAQIGQNKPTSQAIAQARGNSTVMASGISGGTAFDGSWHSVAFRRNGTAFKLFVDGTSVASTTATLATGSTCNRTTLMHLLSAERLDTLRVASNTPRFGIERCQIARLWPYKQLGLLILRLRRLLAQHQLRQRRQRLRQQRPLPLLPRLPTAHSNGNTDAYRDSNGNTERYRDSYADAYANAYSG